MWNRATQEREEKEREEKEREREKEEKSKIRNQTQLIPIQNDSSGRPIRVQCKQYG